MNPDPARLTPSERRLLENIQMAFPLSRTVTKPERESAQRLGTLGFAFNRGDDWTLDAPGREYLNPTPSPADTFVPRRVGLTYSIFLGPVCWGSGLTEYIAKALCSDLNTGRRPSHVRVTGASR